MGGWRTASRLLLIFRSRDRTVLPSSLAPPSRTGAQAGGWSSASDIRRLPAGTREETSWRGPRGTTLLGAEASRGASFACYGS